MVRGSIAAGWWTRGVVTVGGRAGAELALAVRGVKVAELVVRLAGRAAFAPIVDAIVAAAGFTAGEADELIAEAAGVPLGDGFGGTRTTRKARTSPVTGFAEVTSACIFSAIRLPIAWPTGRAPLSERK
jgi:hypothetical protein